MSGRGSALSSGDWAAGICELVPLGWNVTRVSQFFFSPMRWDRNGQSGLTLVISLPTSHLGSDNTQQVRLRLTSFRGGQAGFLRRTEDAGIFQNGSYSSPVCWEQERIFLRCFLKNSGRAP